MAEIKPVKSVSLKADYQKELKRLQRFIKNAEKKGFSFPINSIPNTPKRITKASVNRLKQITPYALYKKSTYIIPETGEVIAGITAAPKSAQKPSKKEIESYRTSKLSANDLPKGRKKKTAHKTTKAKSKSEIPQESKVIMENLIDSIEPFSTSTLEWAREEIRNWHSSSSFSEMIIPYKERDKNTLSSIIEGAINEYGLENVARRIEENASEVTALIQEILYASGSKEHHFGTGRNQVNEDLTRITAIVKGGPLTPEEARKLHDMQESLEVNN